jgi:hypothetical protein
MVVTVLLESLSTRTPSVRRSKRAKRRNPISFIWRRSYPHSGGAFAYVVNRLDNTVSILTINATNGALTLVASVATGSELFRIAIDLSGHLASYNLKSNGTSTAAGTAATQGAALSVVLRRNQSGDGQSDTKPNGTSLKLNLAPNLTRWRKLLHLCCTSLLNLFELSISL